MVDEDQDRLRGRLEPDTRPEWSDRGSDPEGLGGNVRGDSSTVGGWTRVHSRGELRQVYPVQEDRERFFEDEMDVLGRSYG